MNIKNLKQSNGWYFCPFCDEGYLREIKNDNLIVGFHCLECDVDFEITEGGEII